MTRKALLALLSLFLAVSGGSPWARAQNFSAEKVKSSTENEVRQLIEPILHKYCIEQCKLLNVTATVDLLPPDSSAPGFEDPGAGTLAEPKAASVRVKMLLDDMVGPVSRAKIFELIQEYIDVLDYPVYIETKVTRFPQPTSSANKIVDLRKSIEKRFKDTIQGIFKNFCPEQCVLAELEVKADAVNPEESQYGNTDEFFQEGDTALKIRKISGTMLFDETLTQQEQQNILEMAVLQTKEFKNVDLGSKVLKFPHPIPYGVDAEGRGVLVSGGGPGGKLRAVSSASDVQSNTSSTEAKNTSATNASSVESDSSHRESYEKYETIERVENGDAVQKEIKQVKFFGLIFSSAILLLLIIVAIALWNPKNSRFSLIQPAIKRLSSLGRGGAGKTLAGAAGAAGGGERSGHISNRFEIQNLMDELMTIYAEHPKVAKLVFSRILKEEGIEMTAQYVSIFGESIVIDLLKDSSLQRDVNDLMEFYARNQFDIKDDEKLELLRQLHNRTVAAKLLSFGSLSSNLFEFLAEMDARQIVDLVKHESLTVRAIVMTQCDPQKRTSVFTSFDEATRMKLLSELSRIDNLPRDYIFNVANALKRKKQDNPNLNTESLPGSEVLVGLLEKTPVATQKSIIQSLESNNPENARAVKSKIVSSETLLHLRDAQLLEIVLNLKNAELLQFLRGTSAHVRDAILSKSPKDLATDLNEQLEMMKDFSRDTYQNVERKIISRIKVMANDGLINLLEINERMFQNAMTGGVEMIEAQSEAAETTRDNIKRAAGW